MAAKCFKWTVVGLFLFSILYLMVVWIWANSAAPDLLEQVDQNNVLEDMAPRHMAALVKIEDPTFYAHRGLDVSNGQGLTTITSAVARTVFLGDGQMGGVKGRLQSFYRGVFDCCKRIDFGRDVMALVLNSRLAKQDQLNIFINNAYFGTSDDGQAVVGFRKAAVTYYGKALSELTDDEFYGIVAMLLAPNYYHPLKNPLIHAQRVSRLKAVVNEQCEPDGWLDLTYEHCATDA